MALVKHDWLRVTKSEPCKICQRTSWCARTADGSLVRCQRIESDRPAPGEFGGWFHRTGDPIPRDQRPAKREPEPEIKVDWPLRSRQMFKCPGAAEARVLLAGKLGVDVTALERLGVGIGYDKQGRMFWSFPERDVIGRPVGIMRRFEDGQKLHMRGAKHGLYFEPQWWKRPGPILLPEGGSDTAALLSMGLCGIGRYSNTGGVQSLAMILKEYPKRFVVVLGENDEKPERRGVAGTAVSCPQNCLGCLLCWPGKCGARSTAYKLTELLGRDIHWRMVPGAKDTREWLAKHGANGVEFVKALAVPTALIKQVEMERVA